MYRRKEECRTQNAECRMKKSLRLFFFLHSAFCVLHSSAAQPSSRKSRSLQPAHDMRILLHDFPNQSTAIVLDHDDDRSLVNAEVVVVEPAEGSVDGAGFDGAAFQRR